MNPTGQESQEPVIGSHCAVPEHWQVIEHKTPVNLLGMKDFDCIDKFLKL